MLTSFRTKMESLPGVYLKLRGWGGGLCTLCLGIMFVFLKEENSMSRWHISFSKISLKFKFEMLLLTLKM